MNPPVRLSFLKKIIAEKLEQKNQLTKEIETLIREVEQIELTQIPKSETL